MIYEVRECGGVKGEVKEVEDWVGVVFIWRLGEKSLSV